MKNYDRIIIGAGLYGLYAAERCGQKGEKILILEHDSAPFMRATYINQARVHMGYHYPRSLSTATKSAGYYRRFHDDFSFAINNKFSQVYATSANFSWTDAEQFVGFCKSAGIRCDEISAGQYFKPGMCDGAFLTEEDTYDAHILRDHYLECISRQKGNIDLLCDSEITQILQKEDHYEITYSHNGTVTTACAAFVLNATYASTNQILSKVQGIDPDSDDFRTFNIKYELCEIILCKPSDNLKNVGLTVMDGPFFSIMPFGKTGYHSLTSVTFTPHVTSYDTLPKFSCQENCRCTSMQLDNCNECVNKPQSAWDYMSHLADKYIKPEYTYQYEKSLFSMKPILKSSEVDDSRPTAIRVNSKKPVFISVLSGKINTVYDLDLFLDGKID